MQTSNVGPAFDRDDLMPVVRALLGRPDADVDDWRVELLHGSSSPTAGGVFRVAGTTQAWSVVLKVNVATPGFEDPGHDQYWLREPLAYRSGFLSTLPPCVAAPRCYGVQERSEREVWLWLEDMGTSDERWRLPELVTVAHHLGVMGGSRPAAALPEHPWFTRRWLRAWASHGATAARLLSGEEQMALVLDPASYRLEAIAPAFPRPVVGRMRRLWESREPLLAGLERLPRALFHGDVAHRNAFLRPGSDGETQVVLIDWSFVGPAAVGEEIGHTSAVWSAYADEPAETERALFAAYVGGLREAGWDGDERAVRFASDAHAALRWAFRWTANAIVAATDPEVRARGWDPVESAHWASRMAYYALDRGEAAMDLLERL